jgi:hypothetical protein
MSIRSLHTVFVVSCFLIASGGWAQEAPSAKEQQVRELLLLMRAGDMGVQMIDGMIGNMKEMVPDAPDDYWTTFRQKVKSSDLVDLLVPIYERNLDAADIEELLRFFRSPTGQRFLDKQPVILEQSMTVGQKWGEQLAEQAIKELQETRQPE